VKLTRDGHKEVGEIAEELQKYCIDAPVKCPLIFGGNSSVCVDSVILVFILCMFIKILTFIYS